MNLKKFFRQYQNIFFYRILAKDLSECSTVLDVGCGHSSAIGSINKKKFTSEGIDIHRKTIELSRRRRLHDKYKLGDIRKLSKYYKKKSFDACIAIEVIEHLEKKYALKLISDMETIARKKIIIVTPNGFYKQRGIDGNPYQVHKSGWEKSDLEKLKYKVYGMRGLKYLRNDRSGIKYKPWIFWGACAFLSEIIFFPFSSLSFDLYAVKSLKNRQ